MLRAEMSQNLTRITKELRIGVSQKQRTYLLNEEDAGQECKNREARDRDNRMTDMKTDSYS